MKLLINIPVFAFVLLLQISLYAYPGGVSGYTKKSGTAGCSCHGGSYFNTSVLVKIEGPDTLAPGQTANYTCTVSGGPSTSAGVDIASSTGALNPVSSFLKLLSSELTHKNSVAYTSGKVIFQFTYTAPASAGIQTLYATGSSKKYWNWADNKTVTVVSQQAAIVRLVQGWNIVSVPYTAANMNVSALFPNANSSAYGYNNGYVTNTVLSNGKGYWVRYPQNDSVVITGQTAGNTVPITEGWNLIGAFQTGVPVAGITTTPANILTSLFYEYSNGYTSPQILQPGKGYWVRAAQAGVINLNVKK